MKTYRKQIILYFLLILSYSSMGQDYFSKTFNYYNGNESVDNIFSFDDGYQLIGSGLDYDTLGPGMFDYDVPDNFLFTDKQGNQIQVNIQSEYGLAHYHCVYQDGDTMINNVYRYHDDSIYYSFYYRDRYGDSIGISKEQKLGVKGGSYSFVKRGDTIHGLWEVHDSKSFANKYGYYMQFDTKGNILSQTQIIEPSIEDYPQGEHEYRLYPKDIMVNEDRSVTISYEYVIPTPNFDRILYTAVVKLDPEGNVLWRTQVGELDYTTTNIIYPYFITLDDGSIVVPWRKEDLEIGILHHPIYQVLTRIDKDGNKIWDQEFESKWMTSSIKKIVKAKNGDILGIGSHKYEFDKQNKSVQLGWLFRMSPAGEILWEHYYFDEEHGGATNFFDVVEDEDGSLVVVGGVWDEHKNPIWNNSEYQWMLKVDADGCYEDQCDELIKMGKPKLESFNNYWTEKYNPSQDEIVRSRRYNIGYGGFTNINTKLSYNYLDETDNELDEGSNWKITGYGIRQYEQKVYVYYIDDYRESILYDFGMEPTDEITIRRRDSSTISYTVVEVDTVVTADEFSRRRLRLRCTDDPGASQCGYMTWVEGMGDTRGLLAPLLDPRHEDSLHRDLLCFKSYDEVLYSHPDYNGCWLSTAVEDITIDSKELLVYPNPVSDELRLLLPESMSDISWHIHDRVGNLLMQGEESTRVDELSIPVSDLDIGLYIIEVVTAKGDRMQQKWVKGE